MDCLVCADVNTCVVVGMRLPSAPTANTFVVAAVVLVGCGVALSGPDESVNTD